MSKGGRKLLAAVRELAEAVRGQKLLAAVRELAEAVKCEHEWQETKPLGPEWHSTHCPRCGLTRHAPQEET